MSDRPMPWDPHAHVPGPHGARCPCGRWVSWDGVHDHTGERVADLLAGGETPLFACPRCHGED